MGGRFNRNMHLKRSAVKLFEFEPYSLVEFMECEKRSVPEGRDNPGRDIPDGSFGIRLVLWFPYSCRDDGCIIILGHFMIGSVNFREIPVRLLYSCFQIVRNENPCNALIELEHMDMG